MENLAENKMKDRKPSIEKLQNVIDIQKNKIFSLNSIIEKLPGSIYWKDKNGVYLGCNSFVLKMAEINSYKDIIGKNDFEMPWKNHAQEIRSIDEKVMQSNVSIEIEEQPTLADGQKIIMLTRKTPLRDAHGNVVGILGVSIDITDRKKMELALKEEKEKAEAANKTKTEFLENMRHDIRTPLTGIVGYANIIKEKIDNEEIKQDLDNLIVSSHTLLELLNEILEMVKINSKEIPNFKKKFDLKMKLQEVIKINQSKAWQKQLQLSLDWDQNIPHYLIGDPTRAHRIALELVTNALNFTSKGHVRLGASLQKRFERDLVIKITVEDTGIGIEPDKQEDIFIQFKRLTCSYQGIYKGIGLGLTIVKQFIDDVKGEIYVESQPQQGTKFTCFIPYREALTDEPFGSEQETYISENRDCNINQVKTNSIAQKNSDSLVEIQNHILLVEDHPLAANIAKTVLARLACQVDIAQNGKTAIEFAQKKNYDLIFMDIGLPDLDGYEVTKRIRLNELNEGMHVPIIALTAHVDDENRKHCIDVGMNTILIKPLIKEKANDILTTFIRGRVVEKNSI